MPIWVQLVELPAGGIKEGVEIAVEDFSQDLNGSIVVFHVDETVFDEEKCPQKFVLGSNAERPVPPPTDDAPEPKNKRKISEAEDLSLDKRPKVSVIE